MKKKINIGTNSFNYKKDVLSFYKKILNSYDFGEILNDADFENVLELLKTHENSEKKIGIGIKEIKVDKVKYNTKCFHLIRTDLTTDIFSYTKCINGRYSPMTKFSRTCREIINEDLRLVKQAYFGKHSKKGKVQCQESKELCSWEELNVDHRQPNTFSIIVDRFIEINGIDVNKIEYFEIVDAVYNFKDKTIADNFKKYHSEKANLRLVKKGLNLGRSHQARLSQQKKDLRIKI
jgi:hypothetical protein